MYGAEGQHDLIKQTAKKEVNAPGGLSFFEDVPVLPAGSIPAPCTRISY